MQLVLKQVRKTIRELRKSLQNLPRSVPQKAVHDLRTRSRRLEAISTALLPRKTEKTRRLLKSIRLLRKAAGEVRNMDVLNAKVLSLLRHHHDPSLERLLAHLRSARAERAHKLADEFAAERKEIRRRLKHFAKQIEEQFSKVNPFGESATGLFEEIRHWPSLKPENLHAFRIKLKELRYMLQLNKSADPAFMRSLENARVRIGTWHDWEELHRTAGEILGLRKGRSAIQLIAEVENRELALAMRAARSLRNRYMRTEDVMEIAEP